MGTALYTPASSAARANCPHHPRHLGHAIGWTDDLPLPLLPMVVAPVSFEVFQDFEMPADHIRGCDAGQQPCYCAFRFVLTRLRSDDDEVFYEAPVYAETLSAWRLSDARWLVCRTTQDRFEGAGVRTCFSVSDSMPR